MANPQPKPEAEKTYVASVKTALSGPDGGIVKKLPNSYVNGTVKTVLNYLTNKAQLSGDESVAAESVRSEMANEYAIAVNGKPAKLTDDVSSLFEERTHRNVPYQALEMEIASVQEGGLIHLLC